MKLKKHTIGLSDDMLAGLDAVAASRTSWNRRVTWADVARTACKEYLAQHGAKPPPAGVEVGLWFRAVQALKVPTSVTEVARRLGVAKSLASLIVKGLREQGMWPAEKKGGRRG